MIQTLKHRGPDGFGYYNAGPIGLAHARLSIIDLTATGDQPMANEDGSIQVVFNGEIFNYIELRAQLQAAGHQFRSISDTETILHAYEEYGDDFPNRLNGQFAIALWDVKRQRLVLARDRVGIRPLFYLWDQGRLLFASEVKAIAAVASRSPQIDVHGLAQVFTYWGNVGPQTVFSGIRMVPPGCMLTIEGGVERMSEYWDWKFPDAGNAASMSIEEAADQLRELLVDAVRLQLRADVPVGAYLSGGLDSSGIVSLVRQYTSNPLRTFSVAFDDPEFDEREHQQQMVQHLGTAHTTIVCSRRDIGQQFPKLIWHTEIPVLRTASVPLMMLSRLVREAGYKVVLTGEGADEVFAGYDLFKEGKIRRFWASQPDSPWRPALFGRLYGYLRHSPVGNAAYVRSHFGQELTNVADPGYAHRTRWATTSRLFNFFSDDVRSVLREQAPQATPFDDLPEGFGRWAGLSRDQYVEAKTLLSGYLLCSQGDRVAMANSIEGRFPYLDHRVIEFANALPPRYKLRGLREKVVLKDALRDLLPGEIVDRVKQPYRAPDAQSFFENGKPLPFVCELLSPDRLRSAGYFAPDAVGRLLDKCRAGRAIGFADNMAFVGILSTMLLHQQFVQGEHL